MKNILYLIITLLLVGCVSKPATDKPVIAVTILPQKYFVEKIAGDLVHVYVIVPPGSSAELYSPKPSQVKELAAAKAWLLIGKMGFEESWKEKIKQNAPKTRIFDTSVQTNWIAAEIEEHGDHVHLHGIDPHIWMAPNEVKQIATEILKVLTELFPSQKETLKTNYQAFINEINVLDINLKAQLESLHNRKFLIFHPALAYFARQYNLEQIAMEVDGKEPSARQMQDLINLARQEKIKTIFIQKEFSTRNAELLSKEINAKIVTIDPLAEDWNNQLREIAKKISAPE